MITLNKISISKLPDYVEIAYKGDTDLFTKFHVSTFDFKGAVMSTLLMILDVAKTRQLSCYKVIYQKEPIGYVVSYEGVLYSFGINIKFRKKDILLSWWEELKKTIGREFVCRLYRNNTRAIEFLKKQQMIEAEVETRPKVRHS